MNQLYPIIRRKRRPLIVADVPPVAAGPVQPVAEKPPVETVVLADGHQPAPEQPKVTDANLVPQDESY
jgi:hypothetical protein